MHEEEEEVYFVPFAAGWLDAKALEVEPQTTARNYRTKLRNHLIPFFKSTATASTRSAKTPSAGRRLMPAVAAASPPE
jgi:hypothetical protein